MKKFVLFISLLVVSFCALKAQDNIIYEGKLAIREDASISVEEKITISANSKTDLPFSRSLKTKSVPEKILLSKDFKLIKAFVEKKDGQFVIYPEESIYLDEGFHVITLTYIIPNAMAPGISKDTLNFDLNLSGWNLEISQGYLFFTAESTHVINKAKITLKTADGKQSFDIEEDVPFLLTENFKKYKNVSLKIVFEKGFLEESSLLVYWFKNLLYNFIFFGPFLLTFIIVVYCYVLWKKYGEDPKGPFVTEYAPPEGVTPAFAMCVLDRNKEKHYNFDYFFITLSHLIMKGYVSVTEYKSKVCVTALKGDDATGLIDEDKIIYKNLFMYSPKIILDGRNKMYMYNALSALVDRLEMKRAALFQHNLWHMIVPATLTFFSFFFILISEGVMKVWAILCFLISFAAFAIFLKFIDNVTPEFKKLYCKIMGFKQYLETAEQGRIEFSNPFEKERVFCDYLAYAYAFGIGKGLVKLFPAHFQSSLVASLNCMTMNKTMIFDTIHNGINEQMVQASSIKGVEHNMRR